MSKHLEKLYQSSFLNGGNAPYIEAYYEDWLSDENSVPDHWAQAFSGLQNGADLNGGMQETGHLDVQAKFRLLGRMPSTPVLDGQLADRKEASVLRLISTDRKSVV